jgi:hypothetical protein
VASSVEIEEVIDWVVLQLRCSRPLRAGLLQAEEGGGPARQRRRRSDAPVSAGWQRRV